MIFLVRLLFQTDLVTILEADVTEDNCCNRKEDDKDGDGERAMPTISFFELASSLFNSLNNFLFSG